MHGCCDLHQILVSKEKLTPSLQPNRLKHKELYEMNLKHQEPLWEVVIGLMQEIREYVAEPLMGAAGSQVWKCLVNLNH